MAASRLSAMALLGVLVTAAIPAMSMSGCGDAKVAGAGVGGSSGGSAGGGRGGSAGGAGPSTDGPVFEVSSPETPAGGNDAAGGTGAVCAENTVTAQRTPVDLLLLIDASDSMATAGAGTMMSKYQLVRQALLRFTRDPASAGLGIGVQFFPLPGPGSGCQSDVDCGYVSSPTTPVCQPVNACADSVAAGLTRSCRAGGGCGGSTCVPLGRCTKSLLDCTNVGQACPGGMAGDTCTGFGKSCTLVDSLSGCAQALYEQPFVPIATLPTPGERLVSWGLGVRSPSGATPLRSAVAGALTFFARHLSQNAGRKGVMVLASDGAPSPGCPNNTIPATAKLLSDARLPTAMPAIDTYVVGVYTPTDGSERMALEALATAGGTGMPLVIAPNEDLNQRFFETLNRIRGQSLPCELLIPAPSAGAGPLDLNKVNLRFRGASGDEDVLYTGSAARCDPVRGGWYYDVDPATGGMPTKIIVCEATCKKWKGDANASVDLRVGCRTRVID
jgi:hypothetical protein